MSGEEDVLRSFKSQLAMCIAAAEMQQAADELTAATHSLAGHASYAAAAASSLSSLPSHSAASPFSAALPPLPASPPRPIRPSRLLTLLHSPLFQSALRDVSALRLSPRVLGFVRDDSSSLHSSAAGHSARLPLLPLLLHFIRASLHVDDAATGHSITAASAFRRPNSAAAPLSAAIAASSTSAAHSQSPSFSLSALMTSPVSSFYPAGPSSSPPFHSSFSASAAHSASALSSSSSSSPSTSVSLSSSLARPAAVAVFGLLFDCLFVLLRALLSTVAPVPPALLAQQPAAMDTSAIESSPASHSSALPVSSSSTSSAVLTRHAVDAALRHAAVVSDIADSLAALVSDVLLYSPYPPPSPSHAPFIARSAIHNALVLRFLRCLSDTPAPTLPSVPPIPLSTRRHLSSFPDVLDRVRSVMAASAGQAQPPLPALSASASAPIDRNTHLLDELEQLQLRAADTSQLSLPRSFSSSAVTSALLLAPSSTGASHSASAERERLRERLYEQLLHGVSNDEQQQLGSGMAVDTSATGKLTAAETAETDKAEGAADESAAKDTLPLSRVLDAMAARVVTALTVRYKAMLRSRQSAATAVVAGVSAAPLPIDRLPVLKLLHSAMTRCTVLTAQECTAAVQAVAEDLLTLLQPPTGSPAPSLPASSPSLLSALSSFSSLPPSASLLASALSTDPSFSSIFPVISDSLTLSAAALREVVLCCAFLACAAGDESNGKAGSGGGKDKKEQAANLAYTAPGSSPPSTLVVVKKEVDESKPPSMDGTRHRPALPSYLTSHPHSSHAHSHSHALRPSTASQMGLNARIASYAMRAHPYLNMSASSSSASGSSSSSSLSSAPVSSSSFSSSASASAPSSSSSGSLAFPASSSLSDFCTSLLHTAAPAQPSASTSSSLLHDDDDWFLPSFHDPIYSAPSSSSSSSSASSQSLSSTAAMSASASSSSTPASGSFLFPSSTSAAVTSTASSAFTSSAAPLASSTGAAAGSRQSAELDPYAALLAADSSHVRVLSGMDEVDAEADDDEDDEDDSDAIRRLEARAGREMALLRSSVAAPGSDEDSKAAVHDDEDEEAARAIAAAVAAEEEEEDSDDSDNGPEAGAGHGEDSGEDDSDNDDGPVDEGDEDEGEGDAEADGMDEADVDIEAELSEAYSPPPLLETHVDSSDMSDAKEATPAKELDSAKQQPVDGAAHTAEEAAAPAGTFAAKGAEASPGSVFLTSPPHVFAVVRDTLLRSQPTLPSVLLQLINHAYCTLTAHSASLDSWETDDYKSAALDSSTASSGGGGQSSGASGSAQSAAQQSTAADELRQVCTPFFPDSRTVQQYINAPLSSTLSSAALTAPLSPAPSVVTSASSTLLSARYLLNSCLSLALFLIRAERHSQSLTLASAATTAQATAATTLSATVAIITAAAATAPSATTAPTPPPLPSAPTHFVVSAWTSTCCHLLYLFRRQVDVCKLVKKLLTAVAGSDTARHQLSDVFTYQHDFALLSILFYPDTPSLLLTPPPSAPTPPSIFFRTFDSLLSSPPLAYPARLKLLHLLHRVEQQAKRRPTHFLHLVSQCPQLLYVLLLLAVWLADEAEEISTPLCLRLIALVSQQRWVQLDTAPRSVESEDEAEDERMYDELLAVAEGKQREEKSEEEQGHHDRMEVEAEGKKRADESSADICPFLSLFDCFVRQPSLCSSFIQHYLLGSSDSTHRTHAQSFLFFMWTQATPPTRTVLFSQLSAWIPSIPLYGKHAQQLCHLLSAVLTAASESSALGPSSADVTLAVQRLMSAVNSQSAVLSAHPLSDFFFSLSQTLNQQRQLGALSEQAKAQQRLYELYCNNQPCHVCHATSGAEHKDKRATAQPPSNANATGASLVASGSSASAASAVGSSSVSASAAASLPFAVSSAGSTVSPYSELSSPSADFHVHKLSALASDSKFGVQHRAIKLHAAFVIPALVLRIMQPNATAASASASASAAAAAAAASVSQAYSVPQRCVKTIHVYFPSHPASDLSSLPLPYAVSGLARDQRHSHWTLAKSVQLTPTQREAKLSFSLPLHTSFLLIHYASFHASEQREAELLKCPRCHCDVQRGVCPQCRENAYQCRQCRNINYDNLTGFLCNECGHCKYGTFSWSVMAAPSLGVDRIKGEEECRQRISEMDVIAQQLGEIQAEGERLQRDVRAIVNRCSGQLQTVKVRSDDVSAVSAQHAVPHTMEQPPFSSALFTSAVHKRSSISFAQHGLHHSSLHASALLSSHHPSSTATSIAGLSSPLDHLLLTRVRKHHADLSKTFRLYLNTKREVGRYLGHPAIASPHTDADSWQAHSTHCFLCGRDSVGLLVRLLAELPASCMLGWISSSASLTPLTASGPTWQWHAVVERLMAGSGCWSEEDVQQCGKYQLAVLCTEPSLSSASVSYLTERVQPLLLHTLSSPLGEVADAEPFVDFLRLLVLSQLQEAADAVSPVLLAALTLCVEVLLASIERFDSPSVAEVFIAPLLRLVVRAAQLPHIPLSASSSASSSDLSAATRRSSSPLVLDSPALSGEMRSPFFASLSSVGLSAVVMSPALQPQPSVASSQAAAASSATQFSPSKARAPSSAGAAVSSSPLKMSSPACPSLSFPAVRRSPRSSPIPSAVVFSHPADHRSSPPLPHAQPSNPFASSPASPLSIPPLQLPAASSSIASTTTGDSDSSTDRQYVSASRLQSLLARLSSFLLPLGVCSSVPASLLHSTAAMAVWQAGVLNDEPTASSTSTLLARHSVDAWRRYAHRKAGRVAQPYSKLRRLLLNPVDDDVQSSAAHLLFLLSAVPGGQSEQATVGKTAPSSADRMDAEGDEKPVDGDVVDVTSAGGAPATAVKLPFAQQRTVIFLDALLSLLRSMTSDEARHSSHFFAVFAELLNSSPSAAVNAGYKRRCVIRGVLPVIMQRLAEQLTALTQREDSSSSPLLSRAQPSSSSITRDPSFCLYGLSSLLIDLLSVPEVKRSFLRSSSHASAILSSYLRMRGLVFARSRLTELTTQHLHSLVTLIFNADDKRSAIRAYLNALNEPSTAAGDATATAAPPSTSFSVSRSEAYIVQQLVDIIRPPQPSKHYQLVLRKSPTQEEFIRGNMRRSPYSSSSFPGPLFRDIVELICGELKLTNEDNMFELLVAGKIVALDLPISKVYEKVWRPHVLQQQQQQQQAGGVAGGGVGLDVSEREMLRARERERERERDRQRMRARDRERVLLLGADAALSLHSDYMSDSDISDDMAEAHMQLPAAPTVAAPTPPMTVTFRLTGLDGEATEPLVDALPDDETERADPEVEYKECEVMREAAPGGVSGLGQLVRRLSTIRDLSHPVEYKLVQVMLKVLTYACQLQANRRHVLDMQPSEEQQQTQFVGPYVLHVLLQQLILSLSAIQLIPAHVMASSSFKDEPAAKTALDLSLSITQLIHALMAQNKQDAEEEAPVTPKQCSRDSTLTPTNSLAASSAQHFNSLLSLLHSPSVRAHTPLVDSVVAILPGLTFGSSALLQLLYATFAPYLSPLPHAELARDADSQWWLSALIEILSSVPREGALGRHFRQFMFGQRLPHALKQYVELHKPNAKTSLVSDKDGTGTGDAEMESKEDSSAVVRIDLSSSAAASLSEFVELPSLPVVLQLLNGLVAGYPPSQSECASLIPLLQQLESISSSKRVGSLSEQLLASLTFANSSTEQQLAELRSSTKADKQKRAADRRHALLQRLGINSSPELKGKLVLAPAKAAVSLDDMAEDDDLLRCCVCQEGYSYKPGQMLGMYVFVKPVAVAMDDTLTLMADGLPLEGDDDELGVCTVTHFNLIHYRCHQEAVKADKKLKPPKSEWDGALIRNAHTRTNALFPILLPPTASTADDDVSFDQYAQAVETYWARFQFSSRLTLPRFMLVMEDMKMLLLRYANDESFSADSRGGGKDSNAPLIVYLLQMALMCFSQCQIGEGVREAIEKMHRQAVRALKQAGAGGDSGSGGEKAEQAGHEAREGHEESKAEDGKEAKEESKEAAAAASSEEAADVDSLRTSGKRRRRKRSSPASTRSTRSRKKQKKAAATSAALTAAPLTSEEQRLLDMYTAATPAVAAASSTSAAAAAAADDDVEGLWEHAHLDHWLSILAASLLFNSYDEWTAMRWAAITKLMTLTAESIDELRGGGSGSDGSSPVGVELLGGASEESLDEEDRALLLVQRVAACRPVLLFAAIVHQLHQTMHKPPFVTPPPPYPPPTAHWSLPTASSSAPSSPHSSSAATTVLLATRWSFLQRFDALMTRELQSSLIPFLAAHSRVKRDKDGAAEAVAEMEELMERLGVSERVKAEYGGSVEAMLRAMFQRKAMSIVVEDESKMDSSS